MVWDRSAAERIVEEVKALDEAFRKTFDDAFEGAPFDMEKVTDEEFRVFMEAKLTEFPAAQIRDVDSGEEFTASPFIVALQLAENGDTMLHRWEHIEGLR